MTKLVYLAFILIALGAVHIKADLLGCDELTIVDVPVIGPKLQTDEETVTNVFKDLGCSLRQNIKKVGKKIQAFGSQIKEKMKVIGSDIKSSFKSFSQKVSDQTEDIQDDPKRYVEIIDPDILKIEQICGHGYLLDALGNCKKLK